MGINAEHSWADAPVVGHMWEVINVHMLNQILKVCSSLHVSFSVCVVRPCNRLFPSRLHGGGTLQRGCEQGPASSHPTAVADSKGGTVEPQLVYCH